MSSRQQQNLLPIQARRRKRISHCYGVIYFIMWQSD